MIQQKRKEKREEKILLRLDEFNFATRRQLQITENLGGDRNAHRILHRMEKDKTISSFRREQKIYYLSNRGKERIGSNQSTLKRNKIQHTLMRNDLYIKLGMPSTWKKESPIKKGEEVILIPDAIFKKNNQYYFVEVDNKQTMRTNNDKIKKYKDVFKSVFRTHGYHPILIWYTLSEVRKNRLAESCEKQGIKYKIY